MAIPVNKKQLAEAIEINYNKLKADLIDIPEKLTRKKEMDGHAKDTLMSVCDLISYLIGWGELVLKWNSRREKGLNVDFPETGFKWNELGKLALKFYDDYENEQYPKLLVKLDQTVLKIQKLIESKTDKELYKTDWYDGWTLGRLVQFNTSSPYANARSRVRKWKKSKGI